MTALADAPLSITEPGVYDLPADVYHADPVPGGSLSSTGARRLLDSPARFHWERHNPPAPTLAIQVGTAVHTLVLGVGDECVTYPDEHRTPSGAVSTKAATVAWAAEQTAAGRIVLSPTDHARVKAMAEAVLAHPTARRLLEQPGRNECCVFGQDRDTGVWLRARFDRLLDAGTAADLKTTASSASPAGFGAAAARYGYPVQEAHYADTLERATGQQVPMHFVVVEKAPPHLVAVHQFDEAVRMTARDLAAKARQIYAECAATGTWPGHGDELLTTEMPAWWWHRMDADNDLDMVI